MMNDYHCLVNNVYLFEWPQIIDLYLHYQSIHRYKNLRPMLLTYLSESKKNVELKNIET